MSANKENLLIDPATALEMGEMTMQYQGGELTP